MTMRKIREEGVKMGKHDKTVFRWDVPKDAFDIAENQKLRAENQKLRERVAELEFEKESFASFREAFKEYRQDTKETHESQIEELIKDHMDEVHELESQIEKLKEAVVIAALREV